MWGVWGAGMKCVGRSLPRTFVAEYHITFIAVSVMLFSAKQTFFLLLYCYIDTEEYDNYRKNKYFIYRKTVQLIMSKPLVTTLNGIILTFLRPEKLTSTAKLKELCSLKS